MAVTARVKNMDVFISCNASTGLTAHFPTTYSFLNQKEKCFVLQSLDGRKGVTGLKGRVYRLW